MSDRSLKEVMEETIAAADWSRADKDLAQTVVNDYADLVVAKLQGEDIEGELAQVRASLKNVSVAAAVTIEGALLGAARRFFVDLINQLLP